MRWRTLNLIDIEACPDALDALGTVGAVDSFPATGEILERELPGSDIYYSALKVRLTRRHLENAPRLRLIVTPSTGLDHLDVEAARELGKEIVSLRGETAFLNSVTATAEQAWGLLLAVLRKIPAAHQAAMEGRWARDAFRGRQLSGKTLGIVGYGRLGRIVAQYARAFRMPVLACDRQPFMPEDGVRQADFATVLRESDAVSIHIHLTEENRRLFSREAIAGMKPGAVLINTSRGAIIDEAALLDALESGHLGGAGLDVIDGEWNPDPREHPVIRYARSHENVVISPHVGGVTYESQRAAFAFVAECARRRVLELDPAAGREG